tara:strand:- start:496 stop:1032 length:537 start_codon:yes stop_codon:yes gene_type:complete
MVKSKKSVTETEETTTIDTTTVATDLVADGVVVDVHYKGTYQDGETFDSSYDREIPITVTVGAGQLLPGFDSALVGMAVGETKHISLTKDEAYGDRNPNAYAAIPIGNFPDGFAGQLETGATIPLTNAQGQHVLGTVETINEESIIFDMNHPMAGKDLEFDIEIVGFSQVEDGGEDLL